MLLHSVVVRVAAVFAHSDGPLYFGFPTLGCVTGRGADIREFGYQRLIFIVHKQYRCGAFSNPGGGDGRSRKATDEHAGPATDQEGEE